jgi:hypothetical protein
MKNKTVKMVLAVVVLGVCCGAYAGVKTYEPIRSRKNPKKILKKAQLYLLHQQITLNLWILWLMIQRQHLKKMMTAG